MDFLTLSRRRVKRKKNSTQMHYMFQVLHQMGNWFLEEYSIYFKIWLMSEKMREMCDIRNINEIGKNQKCSEIGGKWHHPRIELNWTQCLFPQQWWTHSWRLSRSEASVTSIIFEICNISTDPPHLHMVFRVLAFGADCSFSLDFENSAISSRVYVVNFLSLM